MSNLKKYIIFVILIVSSTASLKAQTLYPGDVTNNGVVTGVDALFIGMAYEETGFGRASITNVWSSQTINMLWGTSFFNGLNHAYADCNGDGVVNQIDLDVVILNFDNSWATGSPSEFPPATQGANPELGLNIISTSPSIIEGDTIKFSVNLGDSNMPANDFYGITFKIKYDTELFQADDLNFELSPTTWIDTDPNLSNVKVISKDNFDEGELMVAITKIDKLPISGSGIIGNFQIVVEELIVGLSQDTSTSITIEDVVMMSPDLSFSPIYTEDLPITISNDTALVISSLESYEQHPTLKIFPNPAKDFIIAESSDAIINQVTLYDLLGREYKVRQEVKSLEKVYLYPLEKLPYGIYIISVKTEKGILSEKILVK